MKVLVTGGDGFVGQHLLSRLLEEGAEVVATMFGSEPARGTLSPAERDRVDWTSLDVLDADAVHETVARTGPDRIIHLAGFASSSLARDRPAEALRTNVEGTLNVVESAADAGEAAPVVVAGSADAYGPGDPPGEPIGETACLRPVSHYGVSKAAQEMVARAAGDARGVDVRIARLFPLVGPGQGEAFVVPSFCRQAASIARGEAEPVLRVGNLDVERDFTDVRDGVRAIVRLAEPARTPHRAYNVCSGVGLRIRVLLDWILEAAGIEARIEADAGRVRAGEPRRIVGSAARQGVRDAYAWVRRSRD